MILCIEGVCFSCLVRVLIRLYLRLNSISSGVIIVVRVKIV